MASIIGACSACLSSTPVIFRCGGHVSEKWFVSSTDEEHYYTELIPYTVSVGYLPNFWHASLATLDHSQGTSSNLRPREEKQKGVCFRSTNFPIRPARCPLSPRRVVVVVPSQLEVGKGEWEEWVGRRSEAAITTFWCLSWVSGYPVSQNSWLRGFPCKCPIVHSVYATKTIGTGDQPLSQEVWDTEHPVALLQNSSSAIGLLGSLGRNHLTQNSTQLLQLFATCNSILAQGRKGRKATNRGRYTWSCYRAVPCVLDD